LWNTDWNMRPEAVGRFRDEYLRNLRSHGRAVQWRRVHLPTGKSQLTFSIMAADEGAWLFRAVRLLCDPQNLMDISREWSTQGLETEIAKRTTTKPSQPRGPS